LLWPASFTGIVKPPASSASAHHASVAGVIARKGSSTEKNNLSVLERVIFRSSIIAITVGYE
jgi:hypothetical protein